MIRLTIFFIGMLSGCSSVKELTIQQNPLPQATTFQQHSDEQDKIFQNILSVSAKSSDGTPAFINLYKSSDGTSISVRIEKRKTPSAANKELARKMKKAIKVIEQKPLLNKDGKHIGERVLLNSKQENSDGIQTAIIWTEGSEIRSVEAPSLEPALEFEKWYLNTVSN